MNLQYPGYNIPQITVELRFISKDNAFIQAKTAIFVKN